MKKTYAGRQISCEMEVRPAGDVGPLIRIDDDTYPLKDETAKAIMTQLYKYFKLKEVMKKEGL